MDGIPLDAPFSLYCGKSQFMKVTAPIAMPTPKRIPANMRLWPPESSKAQTRPPTTIATRLNPRAMVVVIEVCRAFTACSHGDCAKAGIATNKSDAAVGDSARQGLVLEKSPLGKRSGILMFFTISS
jgi:hypothetical protein